MKTLSLGTILILLSLLLLASPVSAQITVSPIPSSAPTEGTASNDLQYGSGFVMNPDVSVIGQSTTQLAPGIVYGSVAIRQIGPGLILATAETEANQVVSIIGYTIYVERWTGSAWTTASTRHDYSNNTRNKRGHYEVPVTPNHYYRLRVVHYIIHNGVQSTLQSTSTYIYVN